MLDINHTGPGPSGPPIVTPDPHWRLHPLGLAISQASRWRACPARADALDLDMAIDEHAEAGLALDAGATAFVAAMLMGDIEPLLDAAPDVLSRVGKGIWIEAPLLDGAEAPPLPWSDACPRPMHFGALVMRDGPNQVVMRFAHLLRFREIDGRYNPRPGFAQTAGLVLSMWPFGEDSPEFMAEWRDGWHGRLELSEDVALEQPAADRLEMLPHGLYESIGIPSGKAYDLLVRSLLDRLHERLPLFPVAVLVALRNGHLVAEERGNVTLNCLNDQNYGR